MKNSMKGALAAGAAAVLLLGGAGSLAYWSSTTTVPGGAIASGTLTLSAPTCSDWAIDTAEPGAVYVPGTTKIVPGDVLTEVCTFDITAVGEHLRASLTPTAASFSDTSALTDQLVLGATYAIGGSPAPATVTEANDGDEVTATVSVTFTGPSADNDSQTLTATLNDITITAQQAHL